MKRIVISSCEECQHKARSWIGTAKGLCLIGERSTPKTGIPDWCPLPDDHQPTTISHAGSSQRVAVSHGYTLLDSRMHPAPIGVKLLCYSSRLGTTVPGEFQQATPQNPYGHTGWIGMPDVPDSLKDWKP